MAYLTLGTRALITASTQPAHGDYAAVAVISVLFAPLGLGMIFNVRGFGERVVTIIVALGTAFDGDGKAARKVAARKRSFSIGWGAVLLWFGIAALLIAALR